jgi:hypothetical protein
MKKRIEKKNFSYQLCHCPSSIPQKKKKKEKEKAD